MKHFKAPVELLSQKGETEYPEHSEASGDEDSIKVPRNPDEPAMHSVYGTLLFFDTLKNFSFFDFL